MRPFVELLSYNQVNPKLAGMKFRGVDLREPEDFIEYAGRWDYGEKNAQRLGQLSKMTRLATEDELSGKTKVPEGLLASNPMQVSEQVPIIQKYLAMGHESMVEMSFASFFITGSRTFLAEISRHRLLSLQVESQRFTKYDNRQPEELFLDTDDRELWALYVDALDLYKKKRAEGMAPQIARYVLPNATMTNMVIGANVREWRHILKLRLDKSAQPEMQEIMRMVYDLLVEIYPNSLTGVLDGGRGVR